MSQRKKDTMVLHCQAVDQKSELCGKVTKLTSETALAKS